MNRLWLPAVLLAGATLTGCGGGYYYRSYGPPPPIRQEFRGTAPGAGYFWIDGHWARNEAALTPGRPDIGLSHHARVRFGFLADGSIGTIATTGSTGAGAKPPLTGGAGSSKVDTSPGVRPGVHLVFFTQAR